MDFDATLVDAHSDKQDARPTYKRGFGSIPSEDEVIEEALRRYFGLRGLAVLDEIAETQAAEGVAIGEEEAMALAVAEVRAARVERAQRASAKVLRVVIDPNVVVSAAVSPDGVTGRLIRLGLAGQFRMIVCPMLLEPRSSSSTPGRAGPGHRCVPRR